MTSKEQSESAFGYTAEELASYARENGFEDVTKWMVTRWTGQGLLCSPAFKKSTKHGSDARIYPESQRSIFLQILRTREMLPQGRRYQLGSMAMMIVVFWLFQIDDTPTRQARRALRTFARARENIPSQMAHADADRLVRVIAHPTASRTQIRKAVLLLSRSEKTDDWKWDQIESALSEVCSPWPAPPGRRIERAIPSLGVHPIGVRELVEMLRDNYEVLQALRYEQPSLEQLDEARRRYRERYGFSDLHEPLTLLVNSAGPVIPVREREYGQRPLAKFREELSKVLKEGWKS